MTHQPLLIEIGVEELPARTARPLAEALHSAIAQLLAPAGVVAGNLSLGVTPRRVLLHLANCPIVEPDRREELWGPPEKAALLPDGGFSKAAIGFAARAGLPVVSLALREREAGKGRYLFAERAVPGCSVANLLAESLPAILRRLPAPKQMRWSDGPARSDAFIRPVRWLVARLGEALIPLSFAGVESGFTSQGHRVMGGSGELDVINPFAWLKANFVVADRAGRRALIVEQLNSCCAAEGVELVADDDLIEETTDLVEWPVVVASSYREEFLRLPEEVSRIVLKQHQRCFATRRGGVVANVFLTVANLASSNPASVAAGNAKVVNARLADAAFYFDRDPQTRLETRVEKLNGVIFQQGLGTVGDQVARLRGFVLDLAPALGLHADDLQRAAYLCKSDLTTGLVGEFPELQGYIGGVYARLQHEPEQVARAIAGHYLPAGATDDLPDSPESRAIGIAERTDKLLGYFHLGRIPTASADPYALRRAAIGLIRLLIASQLPLSLAQLLDISSRQWNQQRQTLAINNETQERVASFIGERLLGMSESLGVANRQALEAALAATTPRCLTETVAVARLLSDFAGSETGQAVAAANKRIANILKKSATETGAVNPALFGEFAEAELFAALQEVEKSSAQATPAQLLAHLAVLRPPVDRFFVEVMVMADDPAVQQNRLSLLAALRQQFLRLADLSLLPG